MESWGDSSVAEHLPTWEALASVPSMTKQVSKHTALFRQAQRLGHEDGRIRSSKLASAVLWVEGQPRLHETPDSSKQTKTLTRDFTTNLSEPWVCYSTLWTCKKERHLLGHFLHRCFIKINLCLQDFSASPYYENPQTGANPGPAVRTSSQSMLCAADVTREVCALCVSLQPVSRVDAKSSPKLLMFEVVCIY